MTAQLSPTPVFKGFANDGTPLAFGKLFTYIAGTTTKQASYVDYTQTTPNSNPIILNARGECALWLDPTKSYKLTLAPANDTDPPTNPLPGWPVDQINGSLSPSASIIPSVDNVYTLGSPTNAWAQLYLGPNHSPALSVTSGIIGYYPRTAAEIAAGVTPTDYGYAEGDFRRYGVDLTGVASASTILNAILAMQVPLYQPVGTVKLATGIVCPVGTIWRTAGTKQCFINHTGADQGIQIKGSDATPTEIGGFQLTGTASGLAGLYVNGNLRRSRIHDIYVTAYTGAGVYGVDIAGNLANGGVYYNAFDTVGVSGCAKGFRLYSSDGAANGNRANANVFRNCYAQFLTGAANSGDGWFIDYATGNTLDACYREQNTGYGVNCDHVLDLTILGGYSEGNTLGWIKKTANGSVRALGGNIVDSATATITLATGDVFMVRPSVQPVFSDTGGGIGFKGSLPPTIGLNWAAGADVTLQLGGATFETFDNTNGLLLDNRARRKNATVKASAAGVLSFAGVVTEVIEVTLTENVTAITMPTAVDGFQITVQFRNGAGPFTVAGWPAAVKLAGGAFAVTATNGKIDNLTMRYNSDQAAWLEVSRALNM